MLLFAGPPASGKTSYCVELLRKAIRAQAGDVRLLLPTTTMAEHLRNELVREGFVFSPAVISTFSKFVKPFTGGAPVASTAALELIVADLLRKLPLTSYNGVREFAGFRRALVGAIEEFASAGGSVDVLSRAGANPDFTLIFSELAAELKRRGWYFRSASLRRAAETIAEEGIGGVKTVIMAGFYSFTPPELEVLRTVAAKIDLTVGLTEWPGAAQTLAILRSFATETKQPAAAKKLPSRILVKAPTLDQEANEIARRVLLEIERGRQFRDIGILLRITDPYVAALQTALERAGIPARFYFGNPLRSNATVRYLLSLTKAALIGWEHEATLKVLRMPGSPLEATALADSFEYKVRKSLPESGLDSLQPHVPEMEKLFIELRKLTAWADAELLPLSWVGRYKQLRSLVAAPRVDTPEPHEKSLLWREQALALDAFDECLEEAGDALPAGQNISCAEFSEALETVLSAHTLRAIDHRRNVVHVIDAFEARQWKLPVMFVPGLLEKQFPRYHSENAILPDDVRRRLQSIGLPLRTSTERQQDESFLFDLALTRATDTVVLSYPELNGKGDLNLPSFFLQRAQPYTEEKASEVRPAPLAERAREPLPSIYDETLRAYIAGKHAKVAATPVETFLQCPYQFFAQRTLRLQEMPEAPMDRLTPAVQGNIAHKALELAFANKVPVDQAVETAFRNECAAARIPDSYRTEAVRLDLLHNVRLLYHDGRLPQGAHSRFEEPFAIEVAGVHISGKIDRIEVDAQGKATVVDYKYRSKERMGATKRHWEQGALVQAGLYSLAVQRMGYQPATVVYCGFKREVALCGWSEGPELVQIIQEAKERTLTVVQQLRDGRIEPLALDEDKCRYCGYANACRKETYAMSRTAANRTNA